VKGKKVIVELNDSQILKEQLRPVQSRKQAWVLPIASVAFFVEITHTV
jgi:hypothetical protein